MATERRLPFAIMWLVFVLALLSAAALILSPDPVRRAWGFVLLFAPLGVFALLMAAFYWRSRRIASLEPE